MQNEPEVMNLIWRAVEDFIHIWQDSPYEWNTEVDLQVEIVGRLKKAFKKYGSMHLQWAKYKEVKNKGFEKGQLYNRIYCEPSIWYQYEGGVRAKCLPDIVIYDDIDNPEDPPDEKNKINWPMLWVCEIKYQNEFNYALGDKKWDVDKIKYLLQQELDGAKYACCLNFHRRVALRRGDPFYGFIEKNKFGERLREYTIELPSR